MAFPNLNTCPIPTPILFLIPIPAPISIPSLIPISF